MKKPIFTYISAFLLCFGLAAGLKAQPAPTTIFRFENVSIVPINPTPTEQIAITISGFRLDSCVYLSSSNLNVGVNTVNFFFGFQNDPPPDHVMCGPAMIPYDTTIIIGPLPPAVYNINLTGSLSSSVVPPQQLVFEVAPTDCVDANGDIWVTTNQDIGTGSLREAINCANDTPGPNRIRFHIPSTNDQKIRVGFNTDQRLPVLTDPGTIIDGTTQPGFGDNGDFSPKIILDGSFENWNFPISAISIEGDNCQILALEIINFPNDGIDVFNAQSVIIGLPNAGNHIYMNGSETDFFPNAPDTGPWEGSGIVVRGTSIGCQILGNVIGTNENNEPGLGNEWCGIYVRDNANSCDIGGPSPGQSNTIAGNVVGVRVNTVNNCLIQHNAFFCNDQPIELVNGANNDIEPPTILTATPNSISGTAFGISTGVEVFINDLTDCFGSPCQGRYYLGSANVVNGNWTLNPPFANGIVLQGGERLAATAEDGVETSAFSECKVTFGISDCTEADGSIVVTNTLDEGPGSLRSAIECANNTAGGNLIRFDIPGTGPHIIFVGQSTNEALPALTDDGTIIDGTTQLGFGIPDTNPKIILDGQIPIWQLPINALFVRANFCELYGLQIVNFPDDAIDLRVASYCRIGAPSRGNIIYNNGLEQDFFPGQPNSGPWNGCGIVLRNNSIRNEIKGNAIGTNFEGSIIAGNEYCGILVRSTSDLNTIGGTGMGEGNIIAGNEQGIRVQNDARLNTLLRNEIFCNTIVGIEINGSIANDSIDAPSITTANVDTIIGTAMTQEGTIEVFLSDTTGCFDAPCQGKIYLGTTTLDAGEWTLTSPFANGILLNGFETVTAVVTDEDGNSSAFAACEEVSFPCNIQASIIDQLDATCGLANGFTTVEALNGMTPYQYDWGNGPSANATLNDLSAGDYFITVTDAIGCTVVVETTIGDSPVPTLSIINTMDATCMEDNGSFSALADNGTGDFTYDIGTGGQSDTLFSDLAVGNYNVTATDGLGCTATAAVTINNQGQNPQASFTYQTFDATVNFNNTSTNGDSYFWDFGDGNSGTVENPIHIYSMDGDYTACLTVTNVCGNDQFCTLVSILLPLSDFSISGTVAMENGNTVSDVEMTCTGAGTQNTPADGYYEFIALPSGGDYTITPFKNSSPSNGVGILDLALIQRHLLFLDTLDSPYQIIAADVNNNQQIGVSDLVILQRIILFDLDAFPNNNSWRFVPEAHIFPNPLAPLGSGFPETIQLNNLSTDAMDQDFVAIKVGDVSGNANPSLFGADNAVELWTTEQYLKEGQEIEVALTSADLQQLTACQAEFAFDPEKLALADWEATPLLDMVFGTRYLDQGRLPLLWWDKTARADGLNIAADEVVLRLSFEVLQSGGALSEALSLRGGAMRNQVLDSEGQSREIVLRFDQSTSFNPLDVQHFQLGQNQPNPFAEQTVIPFVLPEAGTAEMRIYDLTGRVVYQQSGTFGAGAQAWTIKPSELNANGLYFYELRFAGQTAVRRMIMD